MKKTICKIYSCKNCINNECSLRAVNIKNIFNQAIKTDTMCDSYKIVRLFFFIKT